MMDRGKDLLKRLRSPMAFLEEERSRYVVIEGDRISINRFIKDRDRSEQEIIHLLKARYNTIESTLVGEGISMEDKMDLFLEGIAIKRAVHMVIEKDISNDLDDIERWLEFGRRIT
ncbi:MAG: hypothetical protein KAH57_09520 [Thermoplasmata archaeon]|nr:hypothetical protein [Thermoplasmata archaeon]